VIEVDGADFGLAGVRLVFKLEFLQHAGPSRRAALSTTCSRARSRVGVVAASGGNHGAAVAYAAMKTRRAGDDLRAERGLAAKMEQIRGYGARLEIAASATTTRCSRASVGGANRRAAIHAYDQGDAAGPGHGRPRIRGAGAEARRAAGGGGRRRPHRRHRARGSGRMPVIGVEPEARRRSRARSTAGEPVDAPAGGVAADSLAPSASAALMFPLAQRYVARTVLVTDDAIREAPARALEDASHRGRAGRRRGAGALSFGRVEAAAGRRSACCSAGQHHRRSSSS
jgi:threonine dehydratase